MAQVSATCPVCKKLLYGHQWTRRPSGKNWLMSTEGKWHSCGDKSKGFSKQDNKYPVLGEKSVYEPKYFSCGKCGDNLKEIHNDQILDFYTIPRLGTFGWWCDKCDMFPQVSHRRSDELGNGPKDPNVQAIGKSNRQKIIEQLGMNIEVVGSDKVERVGGARKSGEKPINWMCMNEDGTMMNGWKLSDSLTKWFNEGGKDVIKLLNEKTVFTKMEKPRA